MTRADRQFLKVAKIEPFDIPLADRGGDEQVGTLAAALDPDASEIERLRRWNRCLNGSIRQLVDELHELHADKRRIELVSGCQWWALAGLAVIAIALVAALFGDWFQ